ncbi:MAG: VWA domain-containing protein, partial [Thermodesulfobacteriota bacterium]|nr:VWA domain-containing protein [Thermodesulfobacteriota bacterium]
MLHFAQPLWLIAGIISCLGAALFIRFNIMRRKRELQQFASPHLLAGLTRNVSLSRRRLKNILLVLGLACLFIGLARPQYGNRWVEVKRKGIDILIGVDVSKSMLARDISPDRLERAKLAIKDFVTKLEGDRVGLLPFAGTAFLMCPLTTDHDAFNASLDALDVNTIPKGGTDIGVAIGQAGKVLANEANHKIFVLVTDGEDLGDNGLKAAREAKNQKMTVYTIGVGTPEGELIPMPGERSNTFIQDKAGTFVTSRLDEKSLAEIAGITNGLYVPLGSMGQGFDTIYQQKLTLVPKEEHDQRKRKVPIERFPWPLGAAVLLLGSDFLITGRKSVWALRLPFIKTAGRRKKQGAATLALLLISAVWSSQLRASEGEELFKAGEYDRAGQFYQDALRKNPNDPVLHFNLGDSAYRNNGYEHAAAEFNDALKTEDLTLQAKSYFNRGNAQYFLGAGTEKTDTERTIKLWQQALESYQASLSLQPDDKEAAHNRDVVKKNLEQLKKQEQEKKQEEEKGKDEQKQDNQQDSQDNKDDKKNKDQDQQKEQQQADDNKDQQNPEQNTDENTSDQGNNEEQQEQKNGNTGNEQQDNKEEEHGQQQSSGDKSGQQEK